MFVNWISGTGIKERVPLGQSEGWGEQTAQNETTGDDMHARLLHLMGINHEKLSLHANEVDRYLTDVHRQVIQTIWSQVK